jgi:hypothetical protein
VPQRVHFLDRPLKKYRNRKYYVEEHEVWEEGKRIFLYVECYNMNLQYISHMDRFESHLENVMGLFHQSFEDETAF